MGLSDRDYVRRPQPAASPLRMRASGLSVTMWLIIINVAVHLVSVVIHSSGFTPLLRPQPGGFVGEWSILYAWGHFSSAEAFFERTSAGTVLNLQVWRLITFQFLHDPSSIWHLGLNMFGLWIFGRTVEQFLGSKRYLAFYLICGICGALLYVILNMLGMVFPGLPGVLNSDPRVPLIGASAGVFGVILACAYIAPNEVIQLIFPPIPLKMKLFAYGYVALAAFNLLIEGRNAGGDAAHLGGAAAGYFFIRRTYLLRDFFDVLDNSNLPRKGARSRSKRSSRGGPSESAVNRVLDKVRDEGLSSLSEKERRLLREASEQQADADR